MATFLILNGLDLSADTPDAENAIIGVADGSLSREALLEWIRAHTTPEEL